MGDQNKDIRRQEEQQKNKNKQAANKNQQNKAGQLLADRENEKQNKSERQDYDPNRSR